MKCKTQVVKKLKSFTLKSKLSQISQILKTILNKIGGNQVISGKNKYLSKKESIFGCLVSPMPYFQSQFIQLLLPLINRGKYFFFLLVKVPYYHPLQGQTNETQQ